MQVTAAQPTSAPQTEAAAAPSVDAPPLQKWTEEGVERLAGKGWLQQEQERLALRHRSFSSGPVSVIAPWAARHLAPEVIRSHLQLAICRGFLARPACRLCRLAAVTILHAALY